MKKEGSEGEGSEFAMHLLFGMWRAIAHRVHVHTALSSRAAGAGIEAVPLPGKAGPARAQHGENSQMHRPQRAPVFW